MWEPRPASPHDQGSSGGHRSGCPTSPSWHPSFSVPWTLTAVSTALPTITKQLNGGDNFVWVGSAYALSSTAFLPLSGSLADIFGRRVVMLGSIVFFALGSALAGAAQNMNMLIAARSKHFVN